MTKDDPTVQLSGPQTMEENISRFNLNLNEPLTDQLAKHKLLQRDEEWRETAREAKQQTGYDSKQIDYGGNSRRINCEYVYSEVVDLAAPKGSTGVLSQNSDCSDRSFNDGKANLCLVGGVVENENSRKHNRNGCAKQGKSSPDYIGGSARSDCNDQLKKTDRNRFCERPELSFHPTDAATTKYLSEAAGKVLTSPPLLLKKNPGGDGGGGVKPGSAFLPIEQRISREISCGGISTVYNIPVYPFCVLPFPATTSGPAYPPLSSHPSLVQSSAPDNRLLSKVQSPSAGAQLLSPRVMYSDPHATHRLEALWQQKYPHFPVPPAWMLHQYTDELLRDTTGSTAQPPLASSTVDRLTGREFFGASSIVNSMPVIPSPVDTICVEKKRDRMDDVQDNKRFAAVDAKRADGRRKDELQTRRANVSKEQKGHQTYFTPDPQTRDNKTSSACHWDRSGPPSRPEFLSGVSRVPAAAAAAALRRTEHLVDEFATSAGDAVDQHFQESFLRLNSQTRLDKTKSGREIQLDRSTEKHGIYWNNGYQNWKDSRLSRVQDLQQDKITFDIYGYQSQQRPAYSPERLSDATKIDSFPNKYDKPTFKNEHQEQLLHCFSDKKSQEHHWRPNSGFPAIVNPKMDVKDFRHDGWNQLNTPSRVPDKQLPRTCPTKRINDGKFQTGSQSIASPTPGSVVRESRLGPSRLIAGSPRPLPSVFYNPLDPRMEAVQPYQVSIESVERCPGTWMQYPYDWLINGASSNGLRQQKADGIPPEAHTRLQHGLIPSPAHSSVVRGCDGIEYRTRIMESNHNKSILSASNGAESVNVSNNKRFVERDDDDDDAPQCLKKVKTESVVPRNDELPLVNIGDFKSFVDRAVHDAFHEGSNGRSEAQRVSSSGSSVTKSYNVAALMEQDEERQRMSECGLRCSSDVTDSATTAATQRPTSGHSLTTSGRKSPEIAVELTTLSGKSWSRVESGSDALSTLSSDTSASDDQKGDASNCPSTSNAASASSLHPVLSSRFSPSPRASLPVKKAWLIRYSDNDQKPASDASTSCFPNAGLDDNRLDREKFSFAHTLNSSSENSRLLPFGKSSENPASYIFDSADDRTNEAKTPVSSVVSISKPIPSKDTDSNYSETSVDSNISKNQKSKNPKRSLPSELPSRHTKMAKSASTQKNLTANGEKSRRMREKNSKIWDNNNSSSTVEAASDCHSNPSQLRKKRRVRSTRGALDLKDESLDSCDRRSTSEVFLQDGSCLKVAPRLPKCRECKAQRSNRNGQQNANICKFDAFRKLCYNGKGLLNVAGFLGPSDIEADDVDLWLPCKSKHTSLGVGDGQYLMTHLKEFFTRLLRQDTSLKFSESSEVEPGSLLWHRPMEGVQETCDTCDTTVFDVHWTCKKCGFVVCNECHSRQVAADETEDQDETRKMDWPLCSAKRQHHSPDDLSLTQIIPQEAVSALVQKFSRLIDESKSANETFGNDKPNGKSDEETNAEEDESEVKKKCSTLVTGLTSSGVKQHAPEDLACAKPTSRPIGEEADFTEIGTASKLSPDDIDKEQEQDSCNCSDLPKPKEAQMSTDAVVTSSSPEPPYGALVIRTRSDTKSLEQFQRQWRQSMPVVVRSCKEGGFCSDLWRPDAFTKRFGHLRLELVSCLNGTTHRFQSAEKFWNGFRNASSGKNAGLLRFKDWPLADDWTGALGDHCADLNRALPIPGYTLADGQFNLAAHLPGFFHQPDLATRIHVGYGNLAQGHVTLSKMQANPVDFVNVVTFADHKVPNDSLESRASCVTQLLEDSHFVGNSSQFTENPDKVVAVWHVYHPMYSNKIQAFLNKVSGNTSWKSGDQNHSGSPSETGGYLDAELLDRLQSEVGVHPVVIVQCLCDAVFIPASAFYQMKVVRECVSVTKEFISSESIKSSFSTQPPDGNNSRNYKQEHFQIKNLVYHTMKDCIGVLERPDL